MTVCLGLTYRRMFNENFKICIYHISVHRGVHGVYFKMKEMPDFLIQKITIY